MMMMTFITRRGEGQGRTKKGDTEAKHSKKASGFLRSLKAWLGFIFSSAEPGVDMFIPADGEQPAAGPVQAAEQADAEEPKEKAAGKRAKGGKRIKVNARQLRRNARIVGLVMHPEHKFGVAMWQDAAGVHHGCGPLAWRDVAVRSLSDAVSGVAAAEKAAAGPAGLFGAPEDAFTGLLNRSDVVALLRMLGWKRLHADFKAGNVPEHMAKFTGGKFWARVASLPLSQGSCWKAKGDHLDLWKQDARGLLDLTAWQDSEPDAEAASQEGSKRTVVYMKDVFEVSGKSMKEARFAVLVGCVGVWLEWHHPGMSLSALCWIVDCAQELCWACG